MKRESGSEFAIEKAGTVHELCEVVLDNLARLTNADIRSRLEQPITSINRLLLRIETNKIKGININQNVEELLALLHDLVREVDALPENLGKDAHSVKIIRDYGSNIIQSYAVKMLKLE
jgi:hypothetical protein